jgi:hypothetical protein
MENEMQNRTENSPVIPPVKQGRSPEYAAEIDGLPDYFQFCFAFHFP